MTKEIPIPSKDEVFIVLVDDEDYSLVSRHHWNILYSGDRPYAFTRLYGSGEQNGHTFLMHHMIMGATNKYDHKNNKSLDNQKDNLRPATRNENEWNKGKNRTARGKPCTSKYKGVSFDWRVGKYKAAIKRNGVYYPLGYFVDELEAAKAYNKKAEELLCVVCG